MLGQVEEDLVMRREQELWAAAQRKDLTLFRKYFAPEVSVFCNHYRCSGEEYLMALPGYDLTQFSIDQYETVSVSDEQIQNHYLVYFQSGLCEESVTCHITSTWMKMASDWKIIFHMGTLTFEK